MSMEGWKCWYASRALWSVIVGLVISSAKLFGFIIEPSYQQSLTDLLTLITMIVCFIGAGYGRFFAKSRIGTPEFHKKLQSLFKRESPE